MNAATTTKAQPNEYGVIWAKSKSGKINIALQHNAFVRNPIWSVWGLYTGTHDLAPIARSFENEADARKYCNNLWRTR